MISITYARSIQCSKTFCVAPYYSSKNVYFDEVFFFILHLVRQIIISLATRPCKIPSTPERRVRIVCISQSLDRSLRTDGADTFASPGHSTSLENHEVSVCVSVGGRKLLGIIRLLAKRSFGLQRLSLVSQRTWLTTHPS